jgi:hypothetical protein
MGCDKILQPNKRTKQVALECARNKYNIEYFVGDMWLEL